MINKKKGTFWSLSIPGEVGSWEFCSDEDKIGSRGCMPNNDTAESSLGRTTRNIETGGMTGVHRASGCADMDSSGYIHRDVPVQRKRKRKNTNEMTQKGRQNRNAGKG